MNPFTPLTLPSGSQLINRLAKAAMEENMADRDHAPSEALLQLYRTWAEGGAGLGLSQLFGVLEQAGNSVRHRLTSPTFTVLIIGKYLVQRNFALFIITLKLCLCFL